MICFFGFLCSSNVSFSEKEKDFYSSGNSLCQVIDLSETSLSVCLSVCVSVQGEHRGAVRELVEPGEAVCQPQPPPPPAVQLRAEVPDEGAGAGRIRPHGLRRQAAVLGRGNLTIDWLARTTTCWNGGTKRSGPVFQAVTTTSHRGFLVFRSQQE